MRSPLRAATAVAVALGIWATSAGAQQVVFTPDGQAIVVNSGIPIDGLDPGGPRPAGPEPTGTGRLRGRVVDAETGLALRDTLLQLTGGGLRQSRSVGTDDDGRYEFENLPPGRFNVLATKPGYMSLSYGQRRPFENGRPIELGDRQTLENVDFAVPRGGVIVVRVADESGEPLANVRVLAQRYRFSGGERRLVPVSQVFQGTDDRGEVRVFGLPPGEYYVSAQAQLGPSGLGITEDGRSYITTYFPGTPSTDNAERVTVQVGKEVNASFALVAARLARVSGVVRRSDGSPAGRGSVILDGRTFGRSMQIQATGAFTFADMPPGEYTLQASVVTPPADREMGRMTLTLSGADLTGVVVPVARGGTIRGRLRFDADPPSDVHLAGQRVFLSAANGTGSSSPPADDSGTFAITGVFDPGVLRLTIPPPGWSLKSVTVGGRDVTDTPIGVEGGAELTGVELVLTQTRAQVNGGAVDSKGAAVNDYTVVLFPEDRAQWNTISRLFGTARPDQRGRFRLAGLPAGKYLAAAVDYLETGSERDPDLLERLRERASAVVLAEGDSKEITLTLQ
jgi:hypothetical protein